MIVLYISRRASVYVVYTASCHSMSATVVYTTKNEIIFIQFQLVIFTFPFYTRFSIFSVSVIIIVNGIKCYPLTE